MSNRFTLSPFQQWCWMAGWIVLVTALFPWLSHNPREVAWRSLVTARDVVSRWEGWWPVPDWSKVWYYVFPLVALLHGYFLIRSAPRPR